MIAGVGDEAEQGGGKELRMEQACERHGGGLTGEELSHLLGGFTSHFQLYKRVRQRIIEGAIEVDRGGIALLSRMAFSSATYSTTVTTVHLLEQIRLCEYFQS